MVLGFYGASGLGTEYCTMAEEINEIEHRWDEMIFVDDDPEKAGTVFGGLKVMPFTEAMATYGKDGMEFLISIGEPAVKDVIFAKLKKENCKLINLIHPSVQIAKDYKIGVGCVIKRFDNIPPNAVIGNNVLIQSLVILGHGVVIGDNCVISPFDFIGGDTEIGKNTYIAPHCSLRNGLKIGSNSVVGMGSVVAKDVPDRVIAYGSPCKVVRENEKGRVFSK